MQEICLEACLANQGETADARSALSAPWTATAHGDASATWAIVFSHKITTSGTMGVTAGPTKTVSTLSHALEEDAIALRVCPAKTQAHGSSLNLHINQIKWTKN